MQNLEALADTFEAAGTPGVFSDAGKALAGKLDYDTGCALSAILWRRKIARAIETFETTPAIKTYLREHLSDRGARTPEKRDLSMMARAAQSTRNQWGKPRKAYSPDPACALVMKLSEGVNWGYSQEAYADHSYTLVPVTGEAPADLGTCSANLNEFVRYSDTHTGFAGSGCTYSAELVKNADGMLVVIFCRASISD